MVRRYAHLSVKHLEEYADGLCETKKIGTNMTQSGEGHEDSIPGDCCNALILLTLMVGRIGFEPMTIGLKARCSTN